MTKRSAAQALRDDLAAEKALVERLVKQQTARRADVEDAKARLRATDDGLREANARIAGLEAALGNLIPLALPADQEAATDAPAS